MRAVDLDGVMFVPVVDETHGGAVVEMKMTVGEFFEKCCAGFAPEAVEAIPVAWLVQQRDKLRAMDGDYQQDCADAVEIVRYLWGREQEGRRA